MRTGVAVAFFAALEKIAGPVGAVLAQTIADPSARARERAAVAQTTRMLRAGNPKLRTMRAAVDAPAAQYSVEWSGGRGNHVQMSRPLPQHKYAASSCHSAYTPRKRSGKPRAPRRVSLLHSAN